MKSLSLIEHAISPYFIFALQSSLLSMAWKETMVWNHMLQTIIQLE